jgi:hypothetical protein
MGGPSYATPRPVTQPSGKTIIWSWDTQSWGPYTAPTGKAVSAATMPPGEPGGVSTERGGEAPAPSAAPAAAPSGSPSEGFGFPLKPKATRKGKSPYGSLLTYTGEDR